MPLHIRDLPYQVHTNRELGLMLRRAKPLAMFADTWGHYPEVVGRYLRLFEMHVRRGTFIKREYFELDRSGLHQHHIHIILFALPEEEWRIDAMINLRRRVESGWSEADEREEGRLLGYQEWQNDLWVARRFPRQT